MRWFLIRYCPLRRGLQTGSRTPNLAFRFLHASNTPQTPDTPRASHLSHGPYATKRRKVFRTDYSRPAHPRWLCSKHNANSNPNSNPDPAVDAAGKAGSMQQQPQQTLSVPMQDLKTRCDSGEAQACVDLALHYKHGKDCKRDYRAAASYLLVGSNMGNPEAMTELGSMCLVGYGVDKNADLAYEYFSRAAEQDYPQAQVKMGEMHRMGLGRGGLNYERAHALFSKAAKQDEPRGLFGLGDMYLRGQFVNQDVVRGFQYMSRSAELGLSDAQFTLGLLFATKAVPTTELTQAQVDARTHVGRGEFWLKKAADQNHRDALGRLAELYNRNLSLTAGPKASQDLLAHQYARLAAETGLASAQRDLGFILLNGRPEANIQPDPQKAMPWLFYASQQGYPDAAFAVGFLMSTAPTADIHSKQLREVFDQATQQPPEGLGLGYTLCLDEIEVPIMMDHMKVRALLLQEPQHASKWLEQFKQGNDGLAWDGGVHGGLNGLFAHPNVTL